MLKQIHICYEDKVCKKLFQYIARYKTKVIELKKDKKLSNKNKKNIQRQEKWTNIKNIINYDETYKNTIQEYEKKKENIETKQSEILQYNEINWDDIIQYKKQFIEIRFIQSINNWRNMMNIQYNYSTRIDIDKEKKIYCYKQIIQWYEEQIKIEEEGIFKVYRILSNNTINNTQELLLNTNLYIDSGIYANTMKAYYGQNEYIKVYDIYIHWKLQRTRYKKNIDILEPIECIQSPNDITEQFKRKKEQIKYQRQHPHPSIYIYCKKSLLKQNEYDKVGDILYELYKDNSIILSIYNHEQYIQSLYYSKRYDLIQIYISMLFHVIDKDRLQLPNRLDIEFDNTFIEFQYNINNTNNIPKWWYTIDIIKMQKITKKCYIYLCKSQWNTYIYKDIKITIPSEWDENNLLCHKITLKLQKKLNIKLNIELYNVLIENASKSDILQRYIDDIHTIGEELIKKSNNNNIIKEPNYNKLIINTEIPNILDKGKKLFKNNQIIAREYGLNEIFYENILKRALYISTTDELKIIINKVWNDIKYFNIPITIPLQMNYLLALYRNYENNILVYNKKIDYQYWRIDDNKYKYLWDMIPQGSYFLSRQDITTTNIIDINTNSIDRIAQKIDIKLLLHLVEQILLACNTEFLRKYENEKVILDIEFMIKIIYNMEIGIYQYSNTVNGKRQQEYLEELYIIIEDMIRFETNSLNIDKYIKENKLQIAFFLPKLRSHRYLNDIQGLLNTLLHIYETYKQYPNIESICEQCVCYHQIGKPFKVQRVFSVLSQQLGNDSNSTDRIEETQSKSILYDEKERWINMATTTNAVNVNKTNKTLNTCGLSLIQREQYEQGAQDSIEWLWRYIITNNNNICTITSIWEKITVQDERNAQVKQHQDDSDKINEKYTIDMKERIENLDDILPLIRKGIKNINSILNINEYIKLLTYVPLKIKERIELQKDSQVGLMGLLNLNINEIKILKSLDIYIFVQSFLQLDIPQHAQQRYIEIRKLFNIYTDTTYDWPCIDMYISIIQYYINRLERVNKYTSVITIIKKWENDQLYESKILLNELINYIKKIDKECNINDNIWWPYIYNVKDTIIDYDDGYIYRQPYNIDTVYQYKMIDQYIYHCIQYEEQLYRVQGGVPWGIRWNQIYPVMQGTQLKIQADTVNSFSTIDTNVLSNTNDIIINKTTIESQKNINNIIKKSLSPQIEETAKKMQNNWIKRKEELELLKEKQKQNDILIDSNIDKNNEIINNNSTYIKKIKVNNTITQARDILAKAIINKKPLQNKKKSIYWNKIIKNNDIYISQENIDKINKKNTKKIFINQGHTHKVRFKDVTRQPQTKGTSESAYQEQYQLQMNKSTKKKGIYKTSDVLKELADSYKDRDSTLEWLKMQQESIVSDKVES